MSIKYGKFSEGLGEYTLTSLPEAGLYEYVYKNGETLLKLDQFGIQTYQLDLSTGVALLKRERREIGSPAKLYFSLGGKVFNNFDVYSAQNLSINFKPHAAEYLLSFGDLRVKTTVFMPVSGRKLIMNVCFENVGNSALDLKIMPCVYPYVNPIMMAPWDKPEWYTKSEYLGGEVFRAFTATRYSVAGKPEERQYFSYITNLDLASFELSDERLISATANFSKVPAEFSGKTQNELYAFGQCFAGVAAKTIAPASVLEVKNVFTTAFYGESVSNDITAAAALLNEKTLDSEVEISKKRFEKLFAVRKVETADSTFNAFVNGFLPLELDWVSSLDRGWPTGMRGVRDASNDFEGFIDYDKAACRAVIANIFSKQRSDGWYPRQVPFGKSEKFDLRAFVDSACFFTEFVYDYIAATDDYSILSENFAYYDSPETLESGFEHLKKGVEYLIKPENLGEHGIVKMQGGDWLDCLSGAGIKGRGETVMVSCQLVMSLKYLAEIFEVSGKDGSRYLAQAEELKRRVNEVAYNKGGFYDGVFADDGNRLFSECDPDGEKRVYAPTNSYAIISGVAEGKQQSVINHLETLKTKNGYKLFSTPFGVKPIGGIGKMGTGDFQPYFAENASVYNHGSQLFYARALACAGEHEKLYDALNFAMPFNSNCHAEEDICCAPYAVTNCYHLVPSFYGRTGGSFLTGSVAMIERAVYNWTFGVNFTLTNMLIKPCVPKAYANASVRLNYGDKPVKISYNGYGTQIVSATLCGEPLIVTDGAIVIDKKRLSGLNSIEIELNMAKTL